ncbi:unnamed protein product [Chironomus riparius]|uniref:Nudix hydrolase domain-containing protein n=1 Tax=Chironomus riparius TaxID=315576 RepID=A0A9N9S0G7_9DIPT|nr:unnamed protein product [Chironomus riparius]
MNFNKSSISLVYSHSKRLLQRKLNRIMATQQSYESSNLMQNQSDKWFNKYEHVNKIDGLFQGVSDRFQGITVDSIVECCGVAESFDNTLAKSLEHWIEQKRRAIWFKVYREQSTWIPSLVKNDFKFHHAREDFVMMYKWLPENEEITVPPFAHTMVGVGALVINDKNQVLVVSEKNALIPNSWKLPGGYCEMKENLIEAAIREVQEETNIQTKFESLVSVLAVRHAHSAAFNCSDLYFIMKLIPLTEEITKCEREIAKCCWMDVDEYLNHDRVHETNRSFVDHWLKLKNKGLTLDVVDKTHKLLNRDYQIFYPKDVNEESKKEN